MKGVFMQLVSQSSIAEVISRGLELGADFVDVFIEKTNSEVLSFKNSKMSDIQSGIQYGIGIRLIKGDQVLYGYTNSDDREELLRITGLLGQRFKSQKTSQTISFEKLNYPEVGKLKVFDVSLDQKIAHLKFLDEAFRKDKLVTQVVLDFINRDQQVEIYNSEGLHAYERRPYIRMINNIILQDGNLQTSAYNAPGARGGWEFIEKMDHQKNIEDLIRQGRTTLYAKPCPAGVMPVVIDNGFGGVIFHEACGHLLETTAVEKKASVFWDKKGEMIAHPNLSASDDGTIDSEWGSLSIDDEGMPTQKTKLIENGVLKNFLCDRVGHIKTGHPRTGSGRRQSYKFAPASRMRNTFIEAGPYSREELIASLGNGLYAKKMGGGSVNPATGEFNFSVLEAYMVKDGKIGEAVKGATLIGRGEDIMTKISMVGSDLSLMAGTCGSVSGMIPTTVGQPPLKVDEILVGGRA